MISPQLAHPEHIQDFMMEISTECVFPRTEHGKSYHSDAVPSHPIYLESDVSIFLNQLAQQQKVDVQDLVNDLLRKDIQSIQGVQ